MNATNTLLAMDDGACRILDNICRVAKSHSQNGSRWFVHQDGRDTFHASDSFENGKAKLIIAIYENGKSVGGWEMA